jgi:hypothetical protein
VLSSILPVFWAFMVAFMTVAVYAIVGQSTFGEEFPQYFRTLGTSLFTLFGVATFEGWVDVANEMMGSEVPARRRAWVVTYFVTFLFLVGYVLTSVVVAVLLEHFSEAARIEHRRRLEDQKRDTFHANVFDPIVSNLAMFGNSQELTTRSLELFEILDCDDSGQLSLDELATGLFRLNIKPPIKMTEEDFDVLTLERALCSPPGSESMTPEGFELAIRIQIKDFICKKLGHAVQVSGFEDYFALGFASMHQMLVDLDPNSRHRMLEQSLMGKVQGTGHRGTAEVTALEDEEANLVWRRGTLTPACSIAGDASSKVKDAEPGLVAELKAGSEAGEDASGVGFQRQVSFAMASSDAVCLHENANLCAKESRNKSGEREGEGVQERLENLERTVQGLGEKLDLSLQDLRCSLSPSLPPSPPLPLSLSSHVEHVAFGFDMHVTCMRPRLVLSPSFKHEPATRMLKPEFQYACSNNMQSMLAGMVKEVRSSRWMEQAHVEARAVELTQASTTVAASHHLSDPGASDFARATNLAGHSLETLHHRTLHTLEHQTSQHSIKHQHHISLVQPGERTQAPTAEEMALARPCKSRAVVSAIHSHPSPNGNHRAKSRADASLVRGCV